MLTIRLDTYRLDLRGVYHRTLYGVAPTDDFDKERIQKCILDNIAVVLRGNTVKTDAEDRVITVTGQRVSDLADRDVRIMSLPSRPPTDEIDDLLGPPFTCLTQTSCESTRTAASRPESMTKPWLPCATQSRRPRGCEPSTPDAKPCFDPLSVP